jgi:hypothetical protein
MATKKSPKPKKERAEKYDEKLKVNGSFMDIVKAAVKDADKKSAPKKKA